MQQHKQLAFRQALLLLLQRQAVSERGALKLASSS